METLTTLELLQCHICSRQLIPHPLYINSGAYCPEDGDYFIQRLRGEEPKVIFRPYQANLSVPTIRNTRPIKISSLEPLRFVVPKLNPSTARLSQERNGVGLTIRCDQTGDIFDSLKEAGTAMFLSRTALSEHINRKRMHVKGYTFTIMNKGFNAPFIKKPKIDYKGGVSSQRVRCEQTGQIFDSVRCAARDMHLNRKNMWVHMKDRSRRPRVGGYSFVLIDGND